MPFAWVFSLSTGIIAFPFTIALLIIGLYIFINQSYLGWSNNKLSLKTFNVKTYTILLNRAFTSKKLLTKSQRITL